MASLGPVGNVWDLPTSSLFKVSPGSGSFLVETDPRFTNQRTWLNSDYLLGQLSLDAAGMQQRIGDGFYEQWLIREQVAQLTGRRFLEGYADDEAQYRSLMESGITVALDWNLCPGVALSDEQVARLTSDIVWLVEETVRLPDGTLTTALVPKVYLMPREGDLDGNGTLISAESIDLRLEGDLVNSGTIAGRSVVQLSGDNLRNLGGRITGADVLMQARADLENIGGRIDAQDSLLLSAGRDLTVASTTHTEQNEGENWSASRTNLDRVAGLYVSNPGGTLVAVAGRDVTLAGAEVVNAGAGGQTLISAGRDLNLVTVHTESHHDSSERLDTPKGPFAELFANRPGETHREAQSREIGTTLHTGGDLSLLAGGDLLAQAAQVRSGGDLQVQAGGDLLIVSAVNAVSSSLDSRSTTLDAQDSLQQSSRFTAQGDLHLSAGNDLLLMASQLNAGGDASLTAGNDLTLLAGQNYSYSLTDYQHSGSYGRKTQQRDEVTDLTHVGSSITSGGNLSLQSGGDQHYQAASLQSGADLTLDSGGAIAFEGVKDLHQENHISSSNDWSWMKSSGEGWTDETLRQSQLVAQGNLVIKAVEGISLDIKEIDEHSVSQTIDAMVAADPQLAWLKEMEQRGDIDWQRVKELHDSYEYDQQGMGPATALAVAIAVTAMTGGAAASIAGSVAGAVGTGAVAAGVGAAVGAGFTAVSVQTAMSAINNGGDIDVVFKDITSSDSLKGYVTSMLAAGLVSGVVDSNVNGSQPTDAANASKDAAAVSSKASNATKGFDLSTWSGKGGYALNGLGQALAQATAQSLVNGDSFEENLKGALVSQAYSTMQALAFHAVGDYAEGKWDDGSPEKIALHATIGGLLSKAMGGDFATGAAAAGANEALIEHLSNGLGLDNTTDRGRELEQAASQLIGLVAAGLVEGDLQQGSDIAKNATAFNGQLHAKQKEFAREAAAQSEGEFTVEQLESQLRRPVNLEEGLHPGRDIVSTEDTKYDLGGVWFDSADGIHQVQLLDDPDIKAIQYLMSFDRGYTWGNQDRGILPDQQSLPDVFEYPSGCLPCAAGFDYSLHDVDMRTFHQKEQDQRAFVLGASSLAAIPAMLPARAAYTVKEVFTGFSLGSAFDAGGQYLDGGEYRPMQTVNAGVTSAVAYPLAGAKYLANVLWGGVASGGSTVLNNFVYAEDKDAISSALQGSVAGGLSTGAGSALGFFAGKYLPKRIGATIDPNKPILLQDRGVVNPYPDHIETVFRDFSSGAISYGLNLRD